MDLLKNTPICGSKSLEFRLEAFNDFKHAQFGNADGNINGALGAFFGTSQGSRVIQAALKFQL